MLSEVQIRDSAERIALGICGNAGSRERLKPLLWILGSDSENENTLTSLRNLIRDGHREDMRASIRRRAPFVPALLRMLHSRERYTNREAAARLGIENPTDYVTLKSREQLVFEAVVSEYSLPDWQSGGDERCSISLFMDILLSEVLGNAAIPSPAADREATLSVSSPEEMADLTAERISAAGGFRDYRTIIRSKAEDYEGITGLGHIAADDYWGFQKERLLSAFIALYGIPGEEHQDIRKMVWKWAEDASPWKTPELDLMLPQLKSRKAAGLYSTESRNLDPYFKCSLLSLLSSLEEGKWYDAAELYESYRAAGAPLRLHTADIWTLMEPKAVEFLDGLGNDADTRTEELFRRPLFMGMIILLALLGILEAAERKPLATCRRSTGKPLPYAPGDTISAVSVTPFGSWVLGKSTRKPLPAKTGESPEIMADMPLIGYRGGSARIKSYLQSFSDSVGDCMYAFSLQSFTRGAFSRSDIEARIETFRTLIGHPEGGVWEELFRRALEAPTITERESQGMILRIKDAEAFNEAGIRESLSPLVTWIGSDRLYLPYENEEKFLAIMRKCGFRNPIGTREC